MPRTNKYFRSIPLTAILLMLFGFSLFAQHEQAIQRYITEGKQLTAEGKYSLALEHYNQALLLNGKHDQANYLMAATYYKLGHYPQCVVHCNKAINLLSAYEEEAYLLKGKALMADNKAEKAVENYDRMLVEFPNNYKAYYQQARAYSTLGKLDDAERVLATALRLRSTYADSHLLLGDVMIKKAEHLKAVMALTNFLLIEPRGKRANETYQKLQKQVSLMLGNKQNDISTLSSITEASFNEFSTIESMVNIMENGRPHPTDDDWLNNGTTVVYKLLTNMKKESSFWWNFYASFYNDMDYNKHLETLTYFISQSQASEETQTWIAANGSKIGQLIDWVNAYDR